MAAATLSSGDDPRIMFGDRLYITFNAASKSSTESIEGIVCALADSCVLRTTQPVLPDTESRSVWELTPRLSFDANEILLKEQNRGKFVPLGSTIAQDAVRERKENAEREDKALGTSVSYGQIVLLKDVVGCEFLSMRRPEAGDTASPVRLSSGESASFFKILPGSRARSEGDAVHEKDTVLFVHVDTQLCLAIDTSEEVPYNENPDAPSYHVTGSRDKCFWALGRCGVGAPLNTLQSGDTVQIAHKEHGGLMSLHVPPQARINLPFRFETHRSIVEGEDNHACEHGLGVINMQPFYSTSISTPFARMVTSKDMNKYKENRPAEYWVLERVRQGGGAIKYLESLRLRHTVTGLFLGVHPNDVDVVRRKAAEVDEAEGRPIGIEALGKGLQDVGRLLGSGLRDVNKFFETGMETMAGEALAKKGVLRLFGRSKPKEEEEEEKEEEEKEEEEEVSRIPKIPIVHAEEEKEEKEATSVRLYLTSDGEDVLSHWRCMPSDRTLTRQSVVMVDHILMLQHVSSRYYVHMSDPFSFDQVVAPPSDSPTPRPTPLPPTKRAGVNEGTRVVEMRHFPAVDDIWGVRRVEPHWLATLHTISHHLRCVRKETQAPVRAGAPPEEDPINFDAIAYFLDELVDTVVPWADRRALRPDLDFDGERAQAHLRGARFINKTHQWTQDAAIAAGMLDALIDILYRIRPHSFAVRRNVTSLTFVLLGALCVDNEAAAMLIRHHMPIILFYAGDVPRTGAVTLLTTMYSASHILISALNVKDVPIMIDLCEHLSPNMPMIYKLFSSLCRWKDMPLVRNQNFIGSAFFDKDELTTKYEPGESSTVLLVAGDSSNDVVELLRSSQRHGSQDDRIAAATHLAHLELLTALCEGRNVNHQRVVQERYPLYLLSFILRQEGVPVTLKCAILELIRAAHIETIDRSAFHIRRLRFYPKVSLIEDSLAPRTIVRREEEDDLPPPPGFDSSDIFHVFELMMHDLVSFCDAGEQHIDRITDGEYVYALAVIKHVHMMGLACQFHLLTSVEIGHLLSSCRRLLLLQGPQGKTSKALSAQRRVASIQIETCRLIAHLQDRAMDARLTMLWGLFCSFVESARIQEADVYDSVMDRFLNRIMTVGEEAGGSIIFVRLLQGSSEFLVNYHALKFVLASSRVWRNVLKEFETLDFLVGDTTAEAYKDMRSVGQNLTSLMAQGIDDTLDEIDTVMAQLLTEMLEGCTAPAPEGRSPTLLEREFLVNQVLSERQRILAAVELHKHILTLLSISYQPQYKNLFKLIYRCLYGFAVSNSSNLVAIHSYLPMFLQHIALDVGSVEVISLLLRSRRVVVKLSDADVDAFVDTIKRHGKQARLIRLVAMLCGGPFPKMKHAYHAHQVRVIEHLRESHDELFPVLLNTVTKQERIKTYYRAGSTTPAYAQLQGHIAFIELLAALSSHRNIDAQGYSRNYVSAEQCIELIRDDEAPLELKAAYLAYLHHVYVDSQIDGLSEPDIAALMSVIEWTGDTVSKLIKSYAAYELEAGEGVVDAGVVVARGSGIVTVSDFAAVFGLVVEHVVPLVRSLITHPFFIEQPPRTGGLAAVAVAAKRRGSRDQSSGLGALAAQALAVGVGTDVEKHVRHSARREHRSLSIASSIGSEPESVTGRRSSVRRGSVKFRGMSTESKRSTSGPSSEVSNAMRGGLKTAYGLLRSLMDLVLRVSRRRDMSSTAPAWKRLLSNKSIDAVVDYVDDLQDNPWSDLSRDELMPVNMFLAWYDDHYAEREEPITEPTSPMMIGAGAADDDDELENDDVPLLDGGAEVVPLRPLAPRRGDDPSNPHVFIHNKFAAYSKTLGQFFDKYVEEEDKLLNATLERLSDDSLKKMIVQATHRPPWPTPPLDDNEFIMFVLNSIQHIVKSADKVGKATMIRTKVTSLGGTVRVLRLAATDNVAIRNAALETLELLLRGGIRQAQEAVLREAEVAAVGVSEWSFYGELDAPLSEAVIALTQGEKIVAALGGHGARARTATVFVRDEEESKDVVGLDSRLRASLRLCLQTMLLLCEGGYTDAQNAVREGTGGINLVSRLVQLIEVLAPPIRAGLSGKVGAMLDPDVVQDFCLVLDTLVSVVSGPCVANQVLIIHSAAIETMSEMLSLPLCWHDALDADGIIEIASGDRGVAQRRIVGSVVRALLSLLEGVKCAEHVEVLNRKPLRENLSGVISTYYPAVIGAEKRAKAMSKDVLAEAMQIWILFSHLSSDPSLSWRLRDLRDVSKELRKLFMSHLGQIEVLRDGKLERVLFQKPALSRTYLRKEDKDEILWSVNRSTVTDKINDFNDMSNDAYTELSHRRVVKQSAWRRYLTNPTLVKAMDYTADILTVAINVMLIVSSALLSTKDIINVIVIILGAVQLTLFTLINFSGFVLKYKVKGDTRYRHYLAKVSRVKGPVRDDDVPTKSLSRLTYYLGLHRQGRVRAIAIQLWCFVTIEVFFKLTLLLFAILALVPAGDLHFFGYHILNILAKSPLLLSVVRSVTKNGRSILLTAILGFVVVYWYSIFAYLYFGPLLVKDYEDRASSPNVCTNIFTCWIAILAQFPSGGDFLRERMFFSETGVLEGWPLLFQLSFFFVVIVIIMSVLFGIIVDTFAELRNKRQSIREDMVAKCFICDVESQVFDREGEGFERHIDQDHPMFGYIHYATYLKEQTARGVQLFGVDAWMWAQISANSTSYYPISRSMVLDRCRAKRRVKPPKTDFSNELLRVNRELEKMGEWMISLDRGLKTTDTMLQSLVLQTQPVETEEDDVTPGKPAAPTVQTMAQVRRKRLSEKRLGEENK